MDADTSLHGCIHDVFCKICSVAVTTQNELNSYSLNKSMVASCILPLAALNRSKYDEGEAT